MSDKKTTTRTLTVRYNQKFSNKIFLLLYPTNVTPEWTSGEVIKIKVQDMEAELNARIITAFQSTTLEEAPKGLLLLCAQIADAQAALESYTRYWQKQKHVDVTTTRFVFLICEKI